MITNNGVPMPVRPVRTANDDLDTDSGEPEVSLPAAAQLRFLIGFFLCGLFWIAPFNAASMVLLPQRLIDDGFADPNSMIARLNAAGAAVALMANLLFGALSDRSRSRFGRRTPYMVLGSIAAGTCLFFVSVATNAATIILAWCGLQLFLNSLLAPFLATLSDRIPGTLRVRMSTAYGFGSTLGNACGTMVGALFVHQRMVGFALAAVALALDGFIVTRVWPKEPSAADRERPADGLSGLLRSFAPPTKGASDFYKALFGRFFLLLSYNMVFGYQLYIIESYLERSATQAAAIISVLSVCTMSASLTGMAVAGFLAEKWGRRKPLLMMAAVMMSAGFAVPWLAPSSAGMYAYGLLAGFGYGMYNASNQALSVDVLPNKSEAGKGLGILNLANTSGMILAAMVTAATYHLFGSYGPVFPLAIVVAMTSVAFIASIRHAR